MCNNFNKVNIYSYYDNSQPPLFLYKESITYNLGRIKNKARHRTIKKQEKNQTCMVQEKKQDKKLKRTKQHTGSEKDKKQKTRYRKEHKNYVFSTHC